jgi:hypothetical protein
LTRRLILHFIGNHIANLDAEGQSFSEDCGLKGEISNATALFADPALALFSSHPAIAQGAIRIGRSR